MDRVAKIIRVLSHSWHPYLLLVQGDANRCRTHAIPEEGDDHAATTLSVGNEAEHRKYLLSAVSSDSPVLYRVHIPTTIVLTS